MVKSHSESIIYISNSNCIEMLSQSELSRFWYPLMCDRTLVVLSQAGRHASLAVIPDWSLSTSASFNVDWLNGSISLCVQVSQTMEQIKAAPILAQVKVIKWDQVWLEHLRTPFVQVHCSGSGMGYWSRYTRVTAELTQPWEDWTSWHQKECHHYTICRSPSPSLVVQIPGIYSREEELPLQNANSTRQSTQRRK